MNDSYVRKAKIIKIVDGDTIDAVIELGFRMTTTQRLRLARCNTPEVGQPGYAEAKAYTTSALLNQGVFVQTSKSDNWDRWVAEVWYDADQDNISDLLLAAGLAKPYVKK